MMQTAIMMVNSKRTMVFWDKIDDDDEEDEDDDDEGAGIGL